jgi:GNAT superfamily N-acetyltransferase
LNDEVIAQKDRADATDSIAWLRLKTRVWILHGFPDDLHNPMAATISPITPPEIPALLEMIRELAQFERLEHEMEATTESLHEALFGQNAVAGALLARSNGTFIGYAIYFFTFSSFLGRRGLWLDDVYVRPEFRHRGVGRRLIEAVARIGVEHQCGRFEWTALNWNRAALDVYQKMGARVMDEWVLLRLNSEGIQKLASSDTK